MSTPKINQNVTFFFPTMPSYYVPVLVLGYMSGNPITFNKPFTCVDACKFYPAPLVTGIFPAGTKSASMFIPNDIRLWQSCFSMQTAAGDPLRGCIDLHGSLSFCIGR